MTLPVTILQIRNFITDKTAPFRYTDDEIEFAIGDSVEFLKGKVSLTSIRGKQATKLKTALTLTLQELYVPSITSNSEVVAEIYEHESRIRYDTKAQLELLKMSRTQWERELNSIISDNIMPIDVSHDYD